MIDYSRETESNRMRVEAEDSLNKFVDMEGRW